MGLSNEQDERLNYFLYGITEQPKILTEQSGITEQPGMFVSQLDIEKFLYFIKKIRTDIIKLYHQLFLLRNNKLIVII